MTDYDDIASIDGHGHMFAVSNPITTVTEGSDAERVNDDEVTSAVTRWIEHMDAANIERSIAFDWDNDDVAVKIAESGGRIWSLVVVDPRQTDESIAKIDKHLGHGFLGIKCSPAGDYSHDGRGYYPNDPACFPVYEHIEQRGATMLFHSGSIYRNASDPAGTAVKYCRPIHLDDVARQFPGLNLVVGHVGRPFWDETLSMANLPNLFVDLTWSQLPLPLYRRSIETALAGFGPSRTIFGSDSNLSHPERGGVLLAETKRILGELGTSHSDAEQVLRGTAEALYFTDERTAA